MIATFLLSLLWTGDVATAAPQPSHAVVRPKKKQKRLAASIVAQARAQLDRLPPGARDDCSGFVSSVLSEAGVPVQGTVGLLWERAKAAGAVHHHRPRPGDLVFFDNTADSNGDGRWNDKLSHVGVVLSVDDDGTVRFAHGGTSRGRVIGHLNEKYKHEHKTEDGTVLNDYMRHPRKRRGKKSKTLAAELLRGYARLKPARLSSWTIE